MVQYASGSIKFSGLGSDTDFQEMIDKLSNIESRYVNQLLQWKADWQKRLEAFQQVRSELLNMQTALTGINSMNKFLVKTSTSSEEGVATAVAGADTLNGTYSLEVEQLASQYSWSKKTSLYDKNDVVADLNGEFQYRYKGVQRTLYIPKGTTIEGLKNIINNDSQNPGVRAQLINSQDGLVFQLHSKDTGSANTLIIQNISNMSALGSITLTGQKYIEEESSMTLTTPFLDANGDPDENAVINSGVDDKTFVFSVDGKKKSVSVPGTVTGAAATPPMPGGATIGWLINEINLWGAANIPSQNGEDLAFLDPVTGQFTIEKRDSIHGAGVYNPLLLDVLRTSYADSSAFVPDGVYELWVAPPEGAVQNPQTDTPISVTIPPPGQAPNTTTLGTLALRLQTAMLGAGYQGSVGVTAADPNDPNGGVKLSFGPVPNGDMFNQILNKDWTSDSELIDTTAARVCSIRFTNSDEGAKDADIIKLSLPLNSQCTIREFCNTLNSALGNKGTAKLVQDSVTGKWRMAIEPKNVSHRVTVEDGTLDSMKYELPGEASGAWQINSGQNAKIRVNGWPATGYLETAGNNIPAGSMIEGMSVTLRGVGTTVISVANDTTKVAENVEAFVTAVNDFRTVLQSLTAYDEEKQTLDPDYAESQFEMQKGSLLTGNYGIQLLSSRLKTAVSSSALGFVHQSQDPLTGFVSGDIFSALSQIGITTNAEKGNSMYGLLEVNRIPGYKGMKSLDEALAENPEAVARLFSTLGEGVSNDQGLFQFSGQVMTGITKPGTYSVEYTVVLDYLNDPNNPPGSTGNPGNPRIDTAFINGQQAKIDGTHITLMGPDGDPARGIALDIYDLTPGVTHTGSVSIKDGKVNELLGMMNGSEGLLGSGGALKHLEDNYQTVIENIEKKIKQEDDRLVKWRRTMDLKFSRLEATLARYNSINENLKAQIAQLNTQKKTTT